jgi:hypothetical protein
MKPDASLLAIRLHLSFTPKNTDEIEPSVPREKAFYDDPL